MTSVNCCAVCGVKDGGDTKLLRCGACKSTWYCSKDHQRQHWKTHKPICKTRRNKASQLTRQLPPSNFKVVICGGGVIGVAIAYYLTLMGLRPTIIERAYIGCAASGKAGGFIAKNWTDTTPRQDLMRSAFDLHHSLNAELKGTSNYSFRVLDTLQLLMPEIGKKMTVEKKKMVSTLKSSGARKEWSAWVDGPLFRANLLGNTQSTCQVNPKQFVDHLWKVAQSKGATLQKGIVNGVTMDSKRKVTAVTVDGKDVPCDAMCVCMGPWSGQAQKWFNDKLPLTYGQKCHSITFRPNNPSIVSNTAVFVDFDGREKEPVTNIHPTYEFYPRTHEKTGEVYLHGMDEKWRLPDEEDPLDVEPTPGSIDRLKQVRGFVCSKLKKSTELAAQACYMPVMLDGEPLLDAIPDTKGAFIATATAEWGITMAPSIGVQMSRLICGLKPTINLDKFRCSRIPQGTTLEKQLAMQEYLKILQSQKTPNAEATAALRQLQNKKQ